MNARLLHRYRLVLSLFILGLIASGITAFPLEWETGLLESCPVIRDVGALHDFVMKVHAALHQTYAVYPFVGYGTDWLAFGHLVIAMFFILPLANPGAYRAVLQVGLIGCVGVLVIALICGPIRGIPFFWTLIDCSFGIVGAIPLLYCLHLSRPPSL